MSGRAGVVDALVIIRKLNDPSAVRVQELEARARAWAAFRTLPVHSVPFSQNSLILVLGGDGTMLHGLRMSSKTGAAVLGVHLGSLGFLVDHGPDGLEATLDAIYEQRAPAPQERQLLRAGLRGQPDMPLAVNEVVVSPLTANSVMRFQLAVGGHSAGEHRGSGVVVATPTGSTAYALSLGGAILDPEAPMVQVVTVAPMTLNSRPLVVRAERDIQITVQDTTRAEWGMWMDGQLVGRWDFPQELCVQVVPAKLPARMHLPESWNFYEVLKTKLSWNILPGKV